MNREQKDEQIKDLTARFGEAQSVYLVNLSGLTVPQVTDLRRRIKASQGSCRVVKNRLAVRATKGTSIEPLAAHFKGPIGIVAHDTEPVSLAKVLADFAKEQPAFSIGPAVVAGQLMDADSVKKLATLPGLRELRATLLGLMTTPATQLVRLINTPGSQTARVIDERRKQLDGAA